MSEPIFVVGVPRSGTTLLRMMLDAHRSLSAGPEAPWLTEDPELPSLEALATFLCEAPAGVQGHTGVGPEEVHAACAEFTERLLGGSARARGRARWVNKTPKNLLHLPFLARLFPGATVVHLLRDGRDVALSTARTRWKTLDMAPGRARNTFRNALRRWDRWLERFDRDAAQLSLPLITLRYEGLVADPEPTLRGLCEELGLAWDPAVLDPYAAPHDSQPRAREGATSFVQAGRVHADGVYRWRRELSLTRKLAARVHIEPRLRALDYPPTLG